MQKITQMVEVYSSQSHLRAIESPAVSNHLPMAKFSVMLDHSQHRRKANKREKSLDLQRLTWRLQISAPACRTLSLRPSLSL